MSRLRVLTLLLIITLLVSCGMDSRVNDQEPLVDEIVETQASIKLEMLGRSSVKLTFDNDVVYYIDPYAGDRDEYSELADAVLVTHQHTDHNQISKVTLKDDGILVRSPMEIKAGKEIIHGDITIKGVAAYNENHKDVDGCGFIISYKDVVVYHSGDTSMVDEMKNFIDYDIDYAMLCMDGIYNMGPEEAMAVADLIGTEAIIPIHTADSGDWNQNNVDRFAHPNKIVVKPGESYELVDLDNVTIPFDEAIIDIMKDRKNALDTKNYELYMSSITRINPYFYNEQERWFQNMTEDHISNISFEIKTTEMIDEFTAIAYIEQKHSMDKKYTLEYPLLFKFERGAWKDYGYKFEELKTDDFTIKYMKGETRVEEFKKMLEDAFENLSSKYKEKPHPYFEMKLFSDQEMLRQRTIPANMWLFTGWSEPDESLKIYTGHPAGYKSYPGVVQHEVVHHITIRMCNNNLPVWILEGIAMYDGSAQYGFETVRLFESMTKEQVSITIGDLEKLDLSSNVTTEVIHQFYNTSYMYVKYMVETYGHDKFMSIFSEAGKKPFHDSTLNYAFESKNQETLSEVFIKILGKTKEEISLEYLEWLESETIGK